MANSNLIDLTAATTLGLSDLVYSVVDPSGTPADRKMTAANLAKSMSLLGAGALNNIASATPDLSAATTTNVTITGTTAITALGTVTAGAVYRLTFAGALTFTHNGTSLILPGGANITTAAGDVAIMQSLGSGNWRCLVYTKADGTAIVGSSPITTEGDLIIGDASGTGIRLPIGANGEVLTSDGTTAAWAAPSGGGSADATVTGTDDAATDLAALNAAITAVSASATAPKTIAIVGTFAMGATRPSQLQYITLDLTRAYMKQTANFTDAAPWLRGIGMSITGGKFGTSLGAVGADNSILFGDTATAGDGPCAYIQGVVIDATWDSLTAARTLASFAASNRGRGAINVASLGPSSNNRNNFSVTGSDGWFEISGVWNSLTLSGYVGNFEAEYLLAAAFTPVIANITVGYIGGNITTMNGTDSTYTIGSVSGNVTTGAALTSSMRFGSVGGNVSTASSDGCSFTFGTVTGVLTASGTDGVYNIGTLVAASQVLSGANNTYNIGEVSSSLTLSGSGTGLTATYVVGALTVSSSVCRVNIGWTGSTVALSESIQNVSIGYAQGAVTVGANATHSGILVNIGNTIATTTISGKECTVTIAKGVAVVNNGESNVIQVGASSGLYSGTGTDAHVIFNSTANGTHTLAARGKYTFLGNHNNTMTFASGQGSSVMVRTAGNGADVVIADTCDSCIFDITQTGGSASTTVTGGAFNNQINVISDVTPTFTTIAAQCENIVYWQQYSTTVNYPQQLVSYKGPNRAAMPITLAMVNALGAATSGQIAFTTLPASKRVSRAFVLNGGGAAATIATLTASVGPTGSATDIVTASTVFAANAVSDTLGATLTQSYTAGTALVVELVADANLNTATGLANGLIAVVQWE